jgi:Mg/Co/Ni transporter MgtE
MPSSKTFDIDSLDAEACVITHCSRHLLISLEGIDAADLFAQMPDGLMDELIRLAGEERCVRVFGGVRT